MISMLCDFLFWQYGTIGTHTFMDARRHVITKSVQVRYYDFYRDNKVSWNKYDDKLDTTFKPYCQKKKNHANK